MVDPIALRTSMYLESKSNNISSGFKILYCGQNNAINHPRLGMVSVRTIKMVMTGGWFMALFYPHYCPELQRTPKTHPVTTPRFNLAFVKLVNFEIITAVYNNKHPFVNGLYHLHHLLMVIWGIVYGIVLPTLLFHIPL